MICVGSSFNKDKFPHRGKKKKRKFSEFESHAICSVGAYAKTTKSASCNVFDPYLSLRVVTNFWDIPLVDRLNYFT